MKSDQSNTRVIWSATAAPKSIRLFVLDRDSWTCQWCGATEGVDYPDSPEIARIKVGTLVGPQVQERFQPEYLRTVCQRCFVGLRSIPFARPSLIQILRAIRSANAEDQMEVLRWLRDNYD